jgi:hypothetical protein
MKVNNKYKILTPDGFEQFSGITKLQKESHFVISLSNDKIIKCSLNHRFIKNGEAIYAYELVVGDNIDSVNNAEVFVTDITFSDSYIDLYDINDVGDKSIFNVDGIVSHNCDTDFLSSGNSVVDLTILEQYRKETIIDPIAKEFVDKNLWIWKYSEAGKNYVVSADVARGDGADYSTLQVFDVDNVEQVAEYKGQLDTTVFGNFAIEIATKYNDALLIVENNNVGWAVIQTIIDRGYKNLFYQTKDLKYVESINRKTNNKYYKLEDQKVPGFTTSMKTRPLIVAKMEEYTRTKQAILRSSRLIDELEVFIYRNGKPEAQTGYNDDLTMAYAINLWIRDTALRLKKKNTEVQESMLSAIVDFNGNDVSTEEELMQNREQSKEYQDYLKRMSVTTDNSSDDEDFSWLIN